jgi:capsular polysaccharide transport system permease protein
MARNNRSLPAGPVLTRPPLTAILAAQWNVFVALMLRDIRTRFGSAPGFLLAIAWPLSHILILVVLNVSFGRAAPYGESPALWFSTGVVPFMIFSYTARFVMLGIVLNRPLLAFPNIKILDILFSRAIIECLISGLVIIVLMVIFLVVGIDFMPHDPVQAFYALLASFWLGIGFGIFNSIIAMIFVQWITVFMLFIVVLWMTGGVFFVPNHMPEYIRDLLYWHPSIHASEWLRNAYFSSYNSMILDVKYLLALSTASVFAGLVLERLLRGRMLVG